MRLFQTLTAAFALLATAPAQASVVFDAFSTFTGVQGAGHFYYGTVENGPFTNASNCVIPGSICLQSNANDVPGAYRSASAFHFLTVDVPNDRLLLHPGQDSAIFASFVVPTAGVWDYDVSFNLVDVSPTGVGIVGFIIPLGQAVSATDRFILNASNPSLALHYQFSLGAGDRLGLVIDNNGQYYNDSVGVNFTMTQGAVPEPATWALMICGFGLAGAAMRRQRGQAARALIA